MLRTALTITTALIFLSTIEVKSGSEVCAVIAVENKIDKNITISLEFLSNGIKCRRSSTSFNSGHTFFIMAFADSPYKVARAV